MKVHSQRNIDLVVETTGLSFEEYQHDIHWTAYAESIRNPTQKMIVRSRRLPDVTLLIETPGRDFNEAKANLDTAVYKFIRWFGIIPS